MMKINRLNDDEEGLVDEHLFKLTNRVKFKFNKDEDYINLYKLCFYVVVVGFARST